MPDGPFALFDDDEGGGLLLTRCQRRWRLLAGDDPAPLFDALEAAVAQEGWVAIAADYGLAASFESAAPPAPAGASVLRAWRFAEGRRLDARATDAFLGQCLEALPEHQRVAGVAEVSTEVDSKRYAEQVEQILRWIADGDCYQINLTFPLNFRAYGHPLALYSRLRQRQPVRYGGCLATGESYLLSFSPELFFSRTGHRVQMRPMKGTAARGCTAADDDLNRLALLSSAKERAENVMIVDLLRNDLGRLAQPGRVSVDALCQAEAYPTLWQMVSTVSAELPAASLHDLFRALFPCGSVTGAPKIRAMQRIAQLERSPRGLYTGALGWLAASGDCRFNVAIRTFELGGAPSACLGVGSGVVADSMPRREYAECRLKASFVTELDPGFELIETLRLAGGHYPLFALHLERLQRSAQALGFTCPLAEVEAGLTAEAARRPLGIHRVRLTLTHDGRYTIVGSPLPNDSGTPWRVVFSSELLPIDDYLRRHKTTARAAYDRALARLADRPEVFDALFLNADGEVCEGARSNVFVERDDGLLLTPPISSGLLPGVLRRTLLETGRAVEHVLRRVDVEQASRLYLGNAVRGLLPVTLVR
ncbi:MAG: aminodeoxychorismate synthase component I [Dokdonella sp.]|nr:MAG: aminodeoxychorismate synthase component I [Dokdonella sp.]